MKVEQELEAKLRSRTPGSVQFEVAGHVVLYFLVRWMIVEAAVKHGVDPLRLSFLGALRELRDIQKSLITASTRWARVLVQRLLDRIAEHQVPLRPGRRYPRRKQSTNHKRQSKHPAQKKTAAAPKPKATKRQTAKTRNEG